MASRTCGNSIGQKNLIGAVRSIPMGVTSGTSTPTSNITSTGPIPLRPRAKASTAINSRLARAYLDLAAAKRTAPQRPARNRNGKDVGIADRTTVGHIRDEGARYAIVDAGSRDSSGVGNERQGGDRYAP